MKIGTNGLDIVKAFESCMKKIGPDQFKAYLDPVNVLTIGWGHTNHHNPKFTASTVWTQAQCDQALAMDMSTFEAHVSKQAKVALTQNEYDALVSWAFNTGGPASATLWKKLNSGQKSAVPAELKKWDKAGGKVLKGLTRRRLAEAQLFAGDVVSAYKTAGIPLPKTSVETKEAPLSQTSAPTAEAPKPGIVSKAWEWLKKN